MKWTRGYVTDLKLGFHPQARLDVLDAVDWYADRNKDVAAAFRDELTNAGQAILRSPHVWPSYLHGTQRYIMKRFPYAVVYRITDQIEIIAVAHQRRRLGYWANRLN